MVRLNDGDDDESAADSDSILESQLNRRNYLKLGAMAASTARIAIVSSLRMRLNATSLRARRSISATERSGSDGAAAAPAQSPPQSDNFETWARNSDLDQIQSQLKEIRYFS